MARRAGVILIVWILAACAPEPVELAEARAAKDFLFVDVPELELRATPSDSAGVVGTYRLGERVPILDERGGWVEIRIGYDRSGWALREDLIAEKPSFASAGEAEARFVIAPNPVFSAGGAQGHIYLQANVNTEGVVTDVKVMQNTTGSETLEIQNVSALRKARFYPMIINNRTRPFVYDHVVNY